MSTFVSPAARSARRLLLLLGALAAVGPLGVDMYLPGLPDMARSFDVAPAYVQLTLTTFLAGFSVGMLLYGPLSDAYGRRPILMIGILLYTVATLACLLAPTVTSLATFRFFEALGAGAAAVLARAITRDSHAPSEAAKVLSFLQIVTSVGPLTAPLVGGQLLHAGGWRAVFAALLLYGIICSVLVWTRVPETWPAEKRAKSALRQSFRAYGHLLTDKTALAHLLCGGMSYAAMFCYIAGTPFVYISYYHVAPEHYGFFFAANIVGLVGGNVLNAKLVSKLGTMRMISWASGVSIAAALITGFVCVTGIGGLPLLAAALFFVVSTTGVLGANCVTDLMQRYPNNAGAAAALFGAVQFGLGAGAGGLLGVLSTGTPLALGVLIVVCGVCAFIGRTVLLRLHRASVRRAVTQAPASVVLHDQASRPSRVLD
ncbi:major facilitator transporter [Robbsia andropogonis]|uniref:Bcr/CflA family efflux transporter n=1 Tax=Robbsia andropogonis TaxID=28092 RepID=A0A0F5K1Y8_9BURK|nr:Bcr/CflA family multidrug efflux MFS transporter [Robbsia andropogonis]KKB63950.1 major facilitator transporter [Robbsia andropogonis]